MLIDLNTEKNKTQRDIERIEEAIDQAIKVADELIRVAGEENQRLESGRPVTLDDLLVRKQKLSSEFDAFFKQFKAEREAFLYASDDKFNALQDRVQILAQTFMENANNLSQAMSANERRINAIMRAIRDNQDTGGLQTYGSYGQSSAAPRQARSIKPDREV
ncbi:flagellar export chaperone FlgN [uncultured Cohaesibacter sp.]|uniref:flagellar export chaperone FlgN n=1 Tax=uncultured Cohaesibacter sp. TaxID=1002546 RepID=UPI00292E31B8|nr:flagellar export chaperone FlgN [uncultured Cohaesibacter sp.]